MIWQMIIAYARLPPPRGTFDHSPSHSAFQDEKSAGAVAAPGAPLVELRRALVLPQAVKLTDEGTEVGFSRGATACSRGGRFWPAA